MRIILASNNRGERAVQNFPDQSSKMEIIKSGLLKLRNICLPIPPNGDRRDKKWIIGRSEKEQKEIRDRMRKMTESEKKFLTSLQIISPLIAGVTFAAAFQMPGGYGSNGKPILLSDKSFQQFLQYDVVAMCSSLVSLIVSVIASVLDEYLHVHILFSIATAMLIMSLMATIGAFVLGLGAVLPHCSKSSRLLDPSGITYPIVRRIVVEYMLFGPICCILMYFIIRITIGKKAENRVFDVKLEKFDAEAKTRLIKEVRTFASLGQEEAKDLVEKTTILLKQGVTKEEANDIIEKLKAVGGVAVKE